VPAFAVEGTGSYGARLVRFLERAGVSVYACERPRRQERRRGKSDLIDAALAARRLLGGEPEPSLWRQRAYGCAYRLVSDTCSFPQLTAATIWAICSVFPSREGCRCSFSWTFKPKVAGSNPARPIPSPHGKPKPHG
ncbi:MAG: hypothetical protein ACRDNP_10130, partial [Gaiellaceae bacterium]